MKSFDCLTSCLLAALLLSPLPPALAAEAPNPADELAYLRMVLADDELVESATRAPKPLSQIAENVTVVTSEEIEAMNAHTLAEVLNRVTGVFVQFQGLHFGSFALPHIQGSGRATGGVVDERHVLLLLDDIPAGVLGAMAAPESIPVGLIDRIEIVKGPASSTWGSALGGIINVLTKKTGSSLRPTGSLSASYGERDTYDGQAQAAGAIGRVGYYVYGQKQHGDWNSAGADFESKSLFGKANARLSDALVLTLSGGTTKPVVDSGHVANEFAYGQDDHRAVFGRAALDANLGKGLAFHAVGWKRDQRLDQFIQEDGLYPYDPEVPPVRSGDLFRNSLLDADAQGLQGRLVWASAANTLVVGVDYLHGDQRSTAEYGAVDQFYGSPPEVTMRSTVDQVGVYANDTAAWGPFTLTPGLRFDKSSKGGEFTSPSLGAVCRLGGETLLRATVAKGFVFPSVAWVTGAAGLDGNPDLRPEKIWSYQAGVESSALGLVWLKATVFRHEATDSLETAYDSPGPAGVRTVNTGHVWRQGFEAEAETAAFHGLSAKAGFAWVHIERSGVDPSTGEGVRDEDEYEANAGLSYAAGTFRANALGHFVWWDLGPGSEEGKRDDFLWDLNAAQSFATAWGTQTELFATVHNLFNGEQTSDADRGTEDRWVEAGVRIRF